MLSAKTGITFSLLTFMTLIATPRLSEGQTANGNVNSVIIIGNQNSISEALKSEGKTSVDGKTTAIINRNVNGEKSAVYIGDVDETGFQIVNNLRSSDDTHYYRFTLSTMGNVNIEVMKQANYFDYGVAELGGEKIVSMRNSKQVTEFFPPGEYLLFVKRSDKPSPYMISLQLKGM